jgi:hypothetical protein
MRVEGSGKPRGSKLIRISAEIEAQGGTALILSIAMRGDFFALPEEAFEEAEASLHLIPLDGFAIAFEAAMKARGVSLLGISGEDVQEILRKAYREA